VISASQTSYQITNETFHQFTDGATIYGFYFYATEEAQRFGETVLNAVNSAGASSGT
jgi:hypothetical protein